MKAFLVDVVLPAALFVIVVVLIGFVVAVILTPRVDNAPRVDVPVEETQKMELVAAYRDNTPAGYTGIYRFDIDNDRCYVSRSGISCFERKLP